MILNDESLYISGLTNMASSVSTKIGPSYVQADCFDDRNYIKDFCEAYEIDTRIVDLTVQNISFKNLLEDLFGEEEQLIDGLMHWINLRAGKPIKMLGVEDRKLLDELTDGIGPFTYVEDIFFIEFERMVICFMMGNDE